MREFLSYNEPILCGLTCLFSFVLFVAVAIQNIKEYNELGLVKKFKSYSDKQIALRTLYLFKVHDKLLCTCYDYNIPVVYVKPGPIAFKFSNQDAAGVFKYNINPFGQYRHDSGMIFLKAYGSDLPEPYDYGEFSRIISIFAHEVGHLISIAEYGDDSEEGADLEAYKLCESVADPEELKECSYIRIWLDSFFTQKENYEHPSERNQPTEVGAHSVALNKRKGS